MKALVLSGGRGTRLRPITHTSAKQLVPIANRPILFYVLDALAAAGIDDIGVVVGDTAAEVEAAVGDGRAFGVRITYIHQPRPLGLAHAVLTAREFLGEHSFVMHLGDNLIRDSIAPLVDEFRSRRPDAMILLSRVPSPERFGVAEVEGTRVVRLVEKPSTPRSDLALVGVYLFGAAIHPAIDGITPSARGELEITDAIQRLVDEGRTVVPHVISGWWKDTGRLEDMLEANRIVLESIERDVRARVTEDVRLDGRVAVAADATMRDCTVRGPAIIGEGAVVEGAYIGPFTAIGPRCVIRNAEIEHSIVLEDCRIENVEGKIESSLLGRDCVVVGSRRPPRAHRLMLGDHSRVELC